MRKGNNLVILMNS